MQFQMEEAVNLEDFEEAGRIKKKLAAVIAQDPVAGVMVDFKVQCIPCFIYFVILFRFL